MKVLSRIDPLSVMKVGGIIYGCLGLVMAIIFAIFFSIGAMIGTMSGQQDFPITGVTGVVFALLAVIIIPILYGVMGALIAGLMAVLYNFVARRFGGVMYEVREAKEPTYGVPVSSATT